ncbi:MAG: tyrosine/phenylalanine carboxypeptidase domain-containing protein [Sphingomicrobium sp.]
MADAKPTKLRPTFEADFGPTGALRQKVGSAGRVHLDRWLPFLIVNRGGGAPDSLARRIAINSPAYVVWDEADDIAALAALEAVAGRIATETGSLLVITIEDDAEATVADDSPELPSLVASVLADKAGAAGRAGNAVAKALAQIEIDLRHCKVDRTDFSPLLPERFDAMLAEMTGIERLAILIPPIHRRPDGGVYPAIADAMITRVVDAILRCACAFLDNGEGQAPAHYRSLGRSAYLAAALKADRQLSEIQSRFDFLLSISPINTSSAMKDFLESKGTREPKLHYRPLTVDPDAAKRDLYAIELSALEDPTLECLLGEKRRELDAQLTMLATRNTPSFRAASMFLYGAVESDLLADAETILLSMAKDPPRGEAIVADDIVTGANALIDQYRIFAPFDAVVEKRNDVSGLMVSGRKLYVGADSVMPKRRLRALLAHEVSVHLLTYFNGAAQGLGLFRNGLAGYEGVQEGLGVFAEWAVGGLTRTRLRLLAGRVVAVDAMLAGASFIDCWNVLHREHGFTRRGAFGITARVFRSGGLAKDAIYLQGLRTVLGLVIDGVSLDPFWLGKIAVEHIPAIEELLQRKLARPPAVLPAFLGDADTSDRIARLRSEGSIRPVLLGEQNP